MGLFSQPYYPCSLEEKKKFKELLEKGKRRIDEFYQMYLKKEAGCELTAEENVRWERYISVASRHIPRSHAHSYPLDRCPDEIREVLDPAIRAEIKSGCHLIVTRHDDDGITYNTTIHNVDIIHNEIIITSYYTHDLNDPLQRALAFIAESIFLRKHLSRHYSEAGWKNAESHVRIIGELDPKIVEIFYPELLQYDQEDAKQAEVAEQTQISHRATP